MRVATGGRTLRRTVYLAALLAVVGACKKTQKASPDSDAAPGTASNAATTSAPASRHGQPSGEGGTGVADAEAEDVAAPRVVRKARSQEELFDEAAQNVKEALTEAKQKKPDCDKIVDLLDVSFATTGAEMTVDDRPAFAVFASCAKKAERWRLLHAVANAIVQGDATQKATYFLPRALLGLGQYEAAAHLASAALRAWPKEGDAYLTAALASTRVDDWEACSKQADQALVVQRQKGVSDEISAQAHAFKGDALLHQGKIDESSKELDLSKKIKPSDAATKARDRNDVVKRTGLLVDAELPGEVPLGIYPFLVKSLPFTGGLLTLKLSNVGDKPITVRIEASLADVADPIGKSITLVKGKHETLRLSPPLRADFKVGAVKTEAKHSVAYKVTAADGQVLYEETRSATLLPASDLPLALESHQIDAKPSPELTAAWITPAAKPVTTLLESAKKRAGGALEGKEGQTLPQVKAIWAELRERGFDFVREPSIDSESRHAHPARMPAEVIEARGGNALEGSILFASLLEALGLDVLLVRVPGHMFVGWVPTKADHATAEAMSVAVQSPAGTAFFLETTMVGNAPADAAVLRADAELVDAATKKILDDGRGSFLRLTALRKLGIVASQE